MLEKNSDNEVTSSPFTEFDDENCRFEKSEEKNIIDE